MPKASANDAPNPIQNKARSNGKGQTDLRGEKSKGVGQVKQA